MICDSRFESQIAIAIKSRDLEHLASPACADCPCPGFLVLVSAPAPAATLVSEPQIAPCASILLYGPLEIAWVCCPQLPHHPCKNGRTAHVFTAQAGTRRCFPWKNKQEKSTEASTTKSNDFPRNFLTKIQSGKILP